MQHRPVQLAVDRTALDADMLLAQLDLLLDRTLGDVAAHPHAAAANLALANPQLFLSRLDHLVISAVGAHIPALRAGCNAAASP